MKATVHIGCEKTGTTTLQAFLRMHRKPLMQRGILFSQAAGGENHIKLAAYAQRDETRDSLRHWCEVRSDDDLKAFRKQLRRALLREAHKCGCSTVIYSNEHCSSRLMTTDEVERLRDLFASMFDEVEIVVYLRRQDDILTSLYSTAIKSGSCDLISTDFPGRVAQRFNFETLLDRWAATFDVVKPRLYCHDIISDFADASGLDFSGLNRPEARNESLDVVRLEFLRLLNKHLPTFIDGRQNLDRADIHAAMEAASIGDLPGVDLSFLDAVMAEAHSSNAAVARKYFGGAARLDGDPLFGTRSDTRHRAEVRPITVEEAVETAAEVWKYCQGQIRHLKTANADLTAMLESVKA